MGANHDRGLAKAAVEEIEAMQKNDEQRLLHCFLSSNCETFSHADHLHVAWLLLKQMSLQEATDTFRQGAQGLAASRGRPDFYHETITCAFMRLIQERRSAAPCGRWREFADSNPDLFLPNCMAVRRRYRPETIDSPEARVSDLPEDAIQEPRMDSDSHG